MTDFPTLLYTPYPFIYLKPEKGAPLGRCPVLAIIGITPLQEVHLVRKSGNSGLKSNGKVIFRKFRSEIVEYLQTFGVLTICQNKPVGTSVE